MVSNSGEVTLLGPLVIDPSPSGNTASIRLSHAGVPQWSMSMDVPQTPSDVASFYIQTMAIPARK